MQFQLDLEQQMLSDSVARFVQDDYTFEKRQRMLAAGDASSAKVWRAMADNGWLAAALPEAYGGLDGSVLATAIIAQGLGRGLVLEPYLGCAVMAAQTFVAAAPAGLRETWLPSLADGARRLALAYSEPASRGMPDLVDAEAVLHDGSYLLAGVKTLVLGGLEADAHIVSARVAGEQGVSLFLVPAGAPGLTVQATPLHDGRVAAQLTLDAVRVDETLGRRGAGLDALREGLAHAVIALCAELVGVMEQTINLTAEHLRGRQQFGVPLASFQVLQHRMADMAAELELARSMLFAALASFHNDPPERRAEVMGAAKALISRSALNVCGQGIQLHGGIGMTEEYSVGHYFKRAVVSGQLLGANRAHVAAGAAALQRRAVASAKAAPAASRAGGAR